MNRVGILLGCLSPGAGFPRDTWRDELGAAASAGYACVEWLDDAGPNDQNPLDTPAGQARIREGAAASQVAVPSVYARWAVARPFVRVSASDMAAGLERFRALMQRCIGAGIGRIVLPCVQQSALTTRYDEMVMAEVLRAALGDARRQAIEVHLESDLDPARLGAFLDRVGDDTLKVCYSVGLSAASGYRPRDEFAAYGVRIGSVHVWDCVAFGTPAPLGEGIADLRAVFDGLASLSFSGDVIVRSEPPGEGSPHAALDWAVRHLATLNQFRSVRA